MAFVEKARGGFLHFSHGYGAPSRVIGLVEEQITPVLLCGPGFPNVALQDSTPLAYGHNALSPH